MSALPFRFTITSRSGVKKAVKRNAPTHILSILDPGKRVFKTPRMLSADHLEIWFEDVTNPALTYAPQRGHAERILEWGRRLEPDHFAVIHCEAGQSRSTAAAFLLLVQAAGRASAVDMMAAVVANRPSACPNALVVKHGADILGWPELVDIAGAAASRWVERTMARGWLRVD